jgi:gliding motility-associated-like protein
VAQPVASPVTTTIYMLTETITATGCSNSNSVTITVNPSPADHTGSNQIICNGASAGIGAAAIAGETYSWSPAAGLNSTVISNPTATPSVTTTYTLTETMVSDGCFSNNTVEVFVNATPAAATGPNQTICSGSTITIGAAPVAGNTYSWSPATALSSSTSSQPSATPLTTTTYTLTETITATDCQKSNTVTITVNPSPAAFTGPNTSICLGSGKTIGGPPVAGNTYSWSPILGLSSASVSNPYASPVVTTTYTLTETNPITGCSKSNTITVTVNTLPLANAGLPQTICSGTTITIGSAPVAGYTYTWTPPTGLSSTVVSNPTATPAVTTTYTVTVTDGSTGCTKSDSVHIIVNLTPAAATGPNQNICKGSSTTIGAGPVIGNTYSWTPAAGLSSTVVSNPTASPIATTTYTLTETTLLTGCSKTNSVTITVNPLPVANAGPDKTICQGMSVQIGSATVAGQTYSWSPAPGLSSTTVSNPMASPATTTTYIVTVTDGSTTCSATDTVKVFVNPTPAASTGPAQSVCSGSSVVIGAAAVAGNTYSWTPAAGLSSTTVSNPTANPVTTTTYTLTETTTATGCTKTNSVTISVSPQPNALTGPNKMICVGSSTSIGGAAVIGNTYSWTPAAGLSSTSSSSPTANPATTTTYTLTETAPAPGCSKSNTVTVTVNPPPVAHAGLTRSICSGTSTTIGAAAVAGETYSWTPNTGLSSTTISNPTASPVLSTTYTVTETNTATTCSAQDTVTIHVIPSPAADAGANKVICIGGSVSIGGTAVVGDTYSWTPATGLSSTTSSQPTASPATTTTYTLTETNPITGCSKSNSVTVTVDPLPIANTGPNKTICLGSSTTIGATAIAGNTYAWTPAAGLSSTSSSMPVANPTTTTTYTLTESAPGGCMQTGTVTVTVNPVPVADAGPDQTICMGSSTTIGSAPVAGNTYSWAPASGLNSTTSSIPTASPSATTNYVVTVTGSNTCTSMDTVKITVNPSPAANAGSNKTICVGASTILGAATVPGDTYAWSPAGGLSATNTAQPVASPNATTTYTLTETNTLTGCTKSNSVTVTVNTLPVAQPGNAVMICKGSAVTIGTAAVAGDTYSWTPAAGLSSATAAQPSASPAVTTTYTLTVTSSAGCSGSDTVSVKINPLPFPNAYTGPAQTIYEGSSTNIGGAAVVGNTYSWTPNSSLSSSAVSMPSASPLTTTTYTLTETNPKSGCSASNEVIVTVLPAEFYNALSPNGDGKNDFWFIPMLDAYKTNNVLIINRWGSEVWVGANYNNTTVKWTGQNMNGEDLPDGTYYYIITYNNTEKRGWVLLKR